MGFFVSSALQDFVSASTEVTFEKYSTSLAPINLGGNVETTDGSVSLIPQ